MKILVCGGAGYIGSHAVLKLIKDGHKVIVFDNFENGHKEALAEIEKFTKKKIKIIKGDLRKRNDIKNALDRNKRIELVMDFAAYIEVGESVQNPLKYYNNNVIGTLNLISEMMDHKIKKMVFSSTAAVYGQIEDGVASISENHPEKPINPYGKSKLFVETVLRDIFTTNGFSSISLRYFNVAGSTPSGIIGEEHPNESHLIPRILAGAVKKNGGTKIYGDDYKTHDGTCIRDYIYIDDLVDAHILAMKKLMKKNICESINLGSKHGYSVKQIINECKKISKIDFKVEVGPRRAGDPARLVANSRKADKLLKWRVKTDISKIIETAWVWRKNHPKGYKTRS